MYGFCDIKWKFFLHFWQAQLVNYIDHTNQRGTYGQCHLLIIIDIPSSQNLYCKNSKFNIVISTPIWVQV